MNLLVNFEIGANEIRPRTNGRVAARGLVYHFYLPLSSSELLQVYILLNSSAFRISHLEKSPLIANAIPGHKTPLPLLLNHFPSRKGMLSINERNGCRRPKSRNSNARTHSGYRRTPHFASPNKNGKKHRREEMIWVFPKNRDTPKWMVKIMENPIKMGTPYF